MKFISCFTFAVLFFAFQASSALVVTCVPCTRSSRALNIVLSEGIDPISMQAKIEQIGLQGNGGYTTLNPNPLNILFYPVLPDDPDAKYSIYKGPAGTFLSLKIYFRNFSAPEESCNTTLDQIPYARGQVPEKNILNNGEVVKLFCKSSF